MTDIRLATASRSRGLLLAALVSACLCACSFAPLGTRHDAGRQLMAQGKLRESHAYFQEAVRRTPSDDKARALLNLARDQLGRSLLEQARDAHARGDAATTEALLAEAQALPGYTEVVERLRAFFAPPAPAPAEPAPPPLAAATPAPVPAGKPGKKRGTRAVPPAPAPVRTTLDRGLANRLSLQLRDASARTAFEAIAKSAGIDIVLDPGVAEGKRVSITLNEVTARAAIERVALTHGLAWRPLDHQSLLVYGDDAVQRSDYQPLVVKGYRLVNSDPRMVANSLRTVLRFKDVMIDDKLNMIVVRDTPQALALADQLVALHDVPEPEVVLEVEVLEVSRRLLDELGVDWPAQLSLSLLPGELNRNTGRAFDPTLPTTVRDLISSRPGSIGASAGPLTFRARAEAGDVNTLASPRIRTRSREKARILVGERVPNIGSTATATGFITENINYVDVGLKLDVEPQVFPGGDIVIRVGLEVSSISDRFQTRSGTVAYQISTRNANTVLRLKDGENQVLAGLIQDEDTRNGSRVPGLGDLPLVGRLFGTRRDSAAKSEIVLSITPHLVRGIDSGAKVRTSFDGGTLSGVRGRPSAESAESAPVEPAAPPAAKTPDAPAAKP